MKKYLLPNLPYMFMALGCLKLGTAYRLTAGANIGQKLVRIMGAAAIRLLVYVKVKNAKKYRRDEEYGSALWGA